MEAVRYGQRACPTRSEPLYRIEDDIFEIWSREHSGEHLAFRVKPNGSRQRCQSRLISRPYDDPNSYRLEIIQIIYSCTTVHLNGFFFLFYGLRP